MLKTNFKHFTNTNFRNQGLTERLFMRRYSTSSTESLVRSAMMFKGIVRSSEGRLQDTISQLASAITCWLRMDNWILPSKLQVKMISLTYLKMISIKQRMLIFSSSFFSFWTNAGWALRAALWTRHNSW